MAKGMCCRCQESPPSSGGYCRPCNAAWARENRAKAREKVFAHYGEYCACCGEKEKVFLAVDHINNDGAAHRKQMTGRSRGGAPSICIWLVRNGFPPGFQILCHNCNWAKQYGDCPHRKEQPRWLE